MINLNFSKIKKLITCLTSIVIFSALVLSANAVTWTQLTSGTTNNLYGVNFINTDTGWAVGSNGKIIKTTNGGTNWSSQTSGTTSGLYDVIFIDANTGWAVGSNGKIIKTINGGTNWSSQTSNTNRDLDKLYFFNTNTGWVVGDLGVLLKTVNGGTTWSSVDVGTTHKLNSIYFVDANTGWIVGDNGDIFKTTNSGITWTPQTSGTSHKLLSVYFTDANNGWTVGEFGDILHTVNGGAIWTSQISGATKPLNSVYFIDANTGWVVGSDGQIVSTTNGGSTWSPETSGVTNNLNAVYFFGGAGWAVGSSGTIIKTSVTLTLSVSVSADPNSGTNPLTGVDLTAKASGTATGNIIYKFDCQNDGSYEHTSAATTQTTYTATDLCTYENPGTYTVKVVATRGGLTATNTATIIVEQRTLEVSLYADPNTGTNPLSNVKLRATVGGNAVGDTVYKFDCTNDGTFDYTSEPSMNTVFETGGICNYNAAGNYTARVQVQRQDLTTENTTNIVVIQRTLSTVLSANPSNGVAPLSGVTLSAAVSGNATGNIVYSFDCNNDGVFEHVSEATSEVNYSVSGLCNYDIPNEFNAKVKVERQGLTSEDTQAISVISSDEALQVSLTSNPTSGIAPLNDVDLTAVVSGKATGDIIYKFDCTSNGSFEYVASTTLETAYSITDLCDYIEPGTYTAKVEADRALANLQPTEGDPNPTPTIITKTATVEITVLPQPLAITSASFLSSGTVNQFYSSSFSATGGLGEKRFSLLAGNFPPGLNLNPTGEISGTPTQDGLFYFTLAVTDAQPVVASNLFSIFIKPIITTQEPEPTAVGVTEIDPAVGGSSQLVNTNNTAVTVAIEPDAVAETISGYSIVIAGLSKQSTEFREVPSSVGNLITALQFDVNAINIVTAEKITNFNKPLTISVSYLDSDIPAGTDESRLQIQFYNEVISQWEALPTSIDAANNIATAQVSHLTRFALVAAAAPIVIPSLPAVRRGFVAPTPAAPTVVAPKTCFDRVDFNSDKKVNLVDFSILAFWYKKGLVQPRYDINNNGKIDLTEFSILIYCWTR